MEPINPNSWFYWLCENVIYRQSKTPPRRRQPGQEMKVICVGLPRSGTESLQIALNDLGYTAYHGWDIFFERPHQLQRWTRLARRKFYPRNPEENRYITAEEFDEVVGHADAVLDMPASCFASDLIKAYPDAKVILNTRGNLDEWRESVVKNQVHASENFLFWLVQWFDADCWWIWNVGVRLMWRGLFQCFDGSLRMGLASKGKRVHDDHVAMVRGVCRDRQAGYLEWEVAEGWGPLCRFLGKKEPGKPFPRANDRKAFQNREDALMKKAGMRAVRNMILLILGSAVLLWSSAWSPRVDHYTADKGV